MQAIDTHQTTRMKRGKALLTTALIVVTTSAGCADSFAVTPVRLGHASLNTHSTVGSRASNLNMVFEPSSLMLASPILSAAMSTTPALSPMDPFVEAEIFNDAAHVALDFTSLLGPAKLTLRVAAVVGRLLAIAGDYAPDHAMLPEEVVYQSIMLWIASAGLIKSLAPMVKSETDLTMRDRKCFASLFHEAGVDWMQYKLLRGAAMEWRKVSPGAIITTDELVGVDNHNLYWLYSGEVVMQSQGDVVQTVQSKTSHLLGDVTFASSSSSAKKKQSAELPKITTYAGPKGATLLCLDTTILKELMASDESLDKAIRIILFEAMQERIASLLNK